MSSKSLQQYLDQLIEEIENHEHRDELLELMFEQFCDMTEDSEE